MTLKILHYSSNEPVNISSKFSFLLFLIFTSSFPQSCLSQDEGDSILSPLITNLTNEYNIFDFNSHNQIATVVPLTSPHEEIQNFTYQKCFCDIQQVWTGRECVKSGTEVVVPLLQNMYPEYNILLNFILSSVNIRDVNCTNPMLSIELSGDNLFMLETGELYDEETDMIFSLSDYCFELIQEEDRVKIIARVCVLPPQIPFCSSNEEEIVPSLALNVSFGSQYVEGSLQTYKVAQPKCKHEYNKHVLPFTEDDFSFHFISNDIELLWQPPMPAKMAQAFMSDEYCISNQHENKQSSLSPYAVNLCYDDPILSHHIQCNKSVCVRKCCPHNYVYDSASRKCSVHESETNSSIPPFYDFADKSFVPPPDNLLMEYSFPWCSPKQLYIIDPKSNPADEFYLLNNGSLYITLSKLMMPPSLYCVDTFIEEGDPTGALKVISCFLEHVEEKIDYCKAVHDILYPILVVISCAFLTITLVVYSMIPELHSKLHGKSLLSHVTSLLVAFLFQLILKWSSKNLSMTGCKIIALGNQVSFLWAFFWLNVMCFDIWWTLKTMSLIPETGESSRRRFALYSLYAWGCPIIITFFTAVLEFLPASVDKSRLVLPGFGIRGCWFQDTKSTWIYFHGFTLFLYVLNIFFFFHVAAILINGQRSTEGILRTTRKQHKERVYLYLKLFVVMGITWICEVASWQEGTCEYWIFTDIINSLQGVMIFFIFMCNKKVFQKVQAKGAPLFGRVKALIQSPSSSTASAATNSSSQRTTQTSDESSSRRLSTSVPALESQPTMKS